MSRDFWKSSGLHLVERNDTGWLRVTPDLIRAYLTRPEVHPIEDSCSAEVALFEALMADPFRPVDDTELAAFADQDTADNYKMVTRFRDVLADEATLEGAYLRLVQSGVTNTPPVFLDQLVHIILAGLLTGAEDPMRLRAGELFFREQVVSTDDGRVMLADAEVVDLHARDTGGGIGQLLAETGTPMRRIELDVISDDNSEIYWDRSDRFDTVVDLRFSQPANYALARVIEAWLAHFLALSVHVHPVEAVRDEAWRWHIGLDRHATKILNALYNGEDIGQSDLECLLALYRMEIRDHYRLQPDMAGKPIYLGLARAPDGKMKLKPQNLLVNLPLVASV